MLIRFEIAKSFLQTFELQHSKEMMPLHYKLIKSEILAMMILNRIYLKRGFLSKDMTVVCTKAMRNKSCRVNGSWF